MGLEDEKIPKEIGTLKDNLIKSEQEYLKKLEEDANFKKVMQTINKMNPAQLGVEVVNRVLDIDDEKIANVKDLKRTEIELSILMSSIQSWVREKINEKEQEQKQER